MQPLHRCYISNMTKKKRSYDPQAPVRRQMLDEAVDTILGTMEELFTGQNQILDTLKKHTDILENHTSILKNHTDILKNHTDILEKHTARLDEIATKVDTLTLSEHKNLEKRVIRLEDHAFAS